MLLAAWLCKVRRRRNMWIKLYVEHFSLLIPSPLTSSLTLLVFIPASLVTEQLYTPASLSARLLISSCDLPVLFMMLLPSPRRNILPSFCQATIGGGVPIKEHTRTKWSPSVWFIGAGRFSMKGRAVGQTCSYVMFIYDVNSTCVCVGDALTWYSHLQGPWRLSPTNHTACKALVHASVLHC